MITKINTIEQLKSLFLEIFLNKTNKISDISDNSIVNATGFGVAKIAQKCMKDIAIVESHLFPDSASGVYLDNAAILFGASPRNTTPSQSSTFIRIAADPNTQYLAGTQVFSNYNGIQFELLSNITIGSIGWGYAEIRSISSGSNTNAEANSIIFCSPEPAGHIGCTNEYMATGGTDSETDEVFRMRIKKHSNIVSRNTLEFITEKLREFDSDVLRVINLGLGDSGKRQLSVVFQNGKSLSTQELGTLTEQLAPFLSISEVGLYGYNYSFELVNTTWEYIDLDFRMELASNYDLVTGRNNIQVNLTKYLDFRFWDSSKRVEWDDLLSVIKSSEGVSYVPDKQFFPQNDIQVLPNKLPRIRGFIMRDLTGVILVNNSSELPIYYSAY